jgi:hypothetical protein
MFFYRELISSIVENGLIMHLDAGNSSSYSNIQSILFDGNGDYLTVNDNTKLNFNTSDNFTVEGWIKFASLQDGVPLISKGTNSTNSGWTLYYYSNILYFGIPYVSNDISATFNPTLNVWYHICCTRNNGTIRLFINGNLVATESSNTKNYTTIEQLRVGFSHSGHFLNGNVTQVRITKGVARYTASFSPPIVIDHNSDAHKNDVSFLLMATEGIKDYSDNDFSVSINGNTSTTSSIGLRWNDLSNQNNDGIFVNDPVYNSSNLGSIVFDGINDSVDLIPFAENNFSFNIIIKPQSGQQEYAEVLDGNHSSTTNWHFTGYSDGTYAFTGFGNFAIGLGVLQTNTWHHITFTYSAGNFVKYYKNGVLQGQSSVSTVNYSNSFLRLGRWGGGGRNWKGNISLLSLYNRSLTEQEVSQNFNFVKDRYGL